MTGKIENQDAKIESVFKNLNDRFTATQQLMIGLLVAVIVGAGGIIAAILYH